MTLNAVIALICIFLPNSTYFQAGYITVVEDRPTRNSSRDEIANVNFLYDDIVHVLQNTIDSCINSDTDRPGGYALERMFNQIQ